MPIETFYIRSLSTYNKQQADIKSICTEERGKKLLQLQICVQISVVSGVVLRRTITVPILDHLLSELDKWFSSHQQTAFQGLYLVLLVLVTEDLANVSSVVMKVGELYTVDLPNVSSLSGKIHYWYTK